MRLVLWAAVLVSAAACGAGQSGKEPAVTAPDSITVTSTAFRDGETIPRKYTCDGAGVAPAAPDVILASISQSGVGRSVAR